MSIADIVIIAIVVIMALIGLWKGFFKSLISLCGWFISILIALLTAGLIAEAMLDITAVGNFVAGTSGESFSLFGFFRNFLPEELMGLPMGADAESIEAAMGGGVVGAILKPFIGVLTGDAIAASATTVGEGIALALAGGVFEVMVAIGMFIVVRIVMTLLVMFLKSLIKPDKKKGVLGRLGGFLVGAVRGALYCAILLAAVSFLTPFGFMDQVTGEIDKGVIAQPIAQQVSALSGKITSSENYFNKLLKIAGMSSDENPTDETDPEVAELTEYFSGALSDESIIGDEDHKRYNETVQGIDARFKEAAATMTAGNVTKEQVAPLLAEIREGGRIYDTVNSLKADLKLYCAFGKKEEPEEGEKEEGENEDIETQAEQEEPTLDELELRVEQDLANLKFLLNEDTVFGDLFGTVTIDGLRVDHNIEPTRPATPENPDEGDEKPENPGEEKPENPGEEEGNEPVVKPGEDEGEETL